MSGKSKFPTFWDKCSKQPSGCWEWQLGLDKDGYGKTKYNGRHIRAHRAAWIFAYGFEPYLLVLHKCDNPACVNPDHLYLGTSAQNAADRVNRHRQARGEGIGSSKLTRLQVSEIKRRYKPRTYGCSSLALAKEFGVSYRTILYIVKNETWRNL